MNSRLGAAVPGLVASAVAIAGPAIFSDAAMAGQTTQVGPGSVVQSAPPVIQTVPPQTPGATPIVPGPLGQGLPPVVQPAPMAVEPAVPSSSATIGHTAAISLPENASPPPLRGEPVPFPQALPAPTREPLANDPNGRAQRRERGWKDV